MPAIELTDMQRAILKAFAQWSGGFTVADLGWVIGRQEGHESDRKHSALISTECMDLEARGLIRRLDAYKPIVWVKD